MQNILVLFLLFIGGYISSQNNLIGVDERNKDIGTQGNIYKVKADYIIQNNQSKNLYLLRGDAQKGITIKASKKTILPNDTALIVVEFIPKSIGKFNEEINLITSADGLPFQLSISGVIKSIKTDDKTACFYFKKPNNAGVKTIPPMVVSTKTTARDNSNKMPNSVISTGRPVVTSTTQDVVETKKPEFKNDKKDDVVLNENLYKHNNIIFLIDVSSSMKDSMKLPVLKHSMQYLINALRPTDIVTLITYADSVRTLLEALSGANKNELMQSVEKLKANGLTKGNKAILFSLDKAIQHYITEGNNQIILCTDGKFRFYSEDQQQYVQKQEDKKILLTTIGFGNDKNAMVNLKEIAKIGKGNFIHIKSRSKAGEQLLEEIKKNSLIN